MLNRREISFCCAGYTSMLYCPVCLLSHIELAMFYTLQTMLKNSCFLFTRLCKWFFPLLIIVTEMNSLCHLTTPSPAPLPPASPHSSGLTYHFHLKFLSSIWMYLQFPVLCVGNRLSSLLLKSLMKTLERSKARSGSCRTFIHFWQWLLIFHSWVQLPDPSCINLTIFTSTCVSYLRYENVWYKLCFSPAFNTCHPFLKQN